jgi:adenylyl cyclase-associated protein
MWGNKILQKYRNDPGEDSKHHVAFVKGYTALLQGLAAYAKANHATGLSWKANGGDALAAFNGAGSSAPVATVAAPVNSGPPPPGPPPPGPPPGFWKDDKAAAPAAPKTGDCAVNC